MPLFISCVSHCIYLTVFSDGAFAPNLCTEQSAYTRQCVDMQVQAVAPDPLTPNVRKFTTSTRP